MATFTYKAIDRAGKEVSGQSDFSTKDELVEKLREEDLYLVSWKELDGESRAEGEARSSGAKPSWLRQFSRAKTGPSTAGADYKRIRGSINSKTLSTITWQMSIALKSGVTLAEILSTIARETRDEKVRFIFNFAYGRISAGHTLSDSLASFPSVFSEIYINMVRAGETGGFLPKALEEAAAYLKKQDRLNKKIKSMMIYPVMLTLIASGTIIFMATFIMPVFVQAFTDMHTKLPLLTQILLFGFKQLRDLWFVWLGFAIALFFYGRRLYGQIGYDLTIDRLILRVPLLGTLLLKIAISRFLGTLAVLLKTNVSILDSLIIGRAVAGNTALALEIDAIHKAVQSGKPIAEKMTQSKYFPSMVTMMVSNGEQSGNLPEALEKVTEYYVEEVDLAVSDLLSIMEPLIVLSMGLFIALIASGLLMPIFDLAGYVE